MMKWKDLEGNFSGIIEVLFYTTTSIKIADALAEI
jgi:hypothetical protein